MSVTETVTCNCKWCGKPTCYLKTRECNRCWELRHRIEMDTELAETILEEVKSSGVKS